MYVRCSAIHRANELSFRDPSLVHPVLGQGGLPKGTTCVFGLFSFAYIETYSNEAGGPPMLVALQDPIVHVHQGKHWNRAFSSAAMKEYEVIFAKRVRELVGFVEDLLQRSDCAVVDVNKWFKYFT